MAARSDDHRVEAHVGEAIHFLRFSWPLSLGKLEKKLEVGHGVHSGLVVSKPGSNDGKTHFESSGTFSKCGFHIRSMTLKIYSGNLFTINKPKKEVDKLSLWE